MMNKLGVDFVHPLMFVRPLDAPPLRSRGRPRRSRAASQRGRGRLTGSTTERGAHSRERGGRSRRRGTRSRGHGTRSGSHPFPFTALEGIGEWPRCVQSTSWDPVNIEVEPLQNSPDLDELLKDLILSESDSEVEERGDPKRGTQSLLPESAIETQDKASDSEDSTLEEDLYLSSDSSSSSSCSSSSYEITGTSNSEPEDNTEPQIGVPLTGSLKGNYFFATRKTYQNPCVLVDFKTTKITDDPKTVVSRFQHLCLYYTIDQAGIVFTDKLKPLPIRKVIVVLKNLRPFFRDCFHFMISQMKPWIVYGSIILTLIYYWQEKGMSPVASKLLKLLSLYRLDPLRLERFHKAIDNRLSNLKISKETEIAMVCSEVCFGSDDLENCVKFLLRALKRIVEDNMMSDLDHIMPFLKKVFHHLLNKRITSPLTKLFSTIMGIQGNLSYPIDLTIYYDGVLGVNLSQSDSIYVAERTIKLFRKVNVLCYAEASGIAYRGLLVVMAQCRKPHNLVAEVYRMCVNTHAYPQHDTSKWEIVVFSSMSKIEMQVHIIECLKAYLLKIWSGELKMCRSFMTFKVQEVYNNVRSYTYPVPVALLVDHSLNDTVRRLRAVIERYMQVPVDYYLNSHEQHKLVMFYGVVIEFFKNALRLETLEKDTSCVSCFASVGRDRADEELSDIDRRDHKEYLGSKFHKMIEKWNEIEAKIDNYCNKEPNGSNAGNSDNQEVDSNIGNCSNKELDDSNTGKSGKQEVDDSSIGNGSNNEFDDSNTGNSVNQEFKTSSIFDCDELEESMSDNKDIDCSKTFSSDIQEINDSSMFF